MCRDSHIQKKGVGCDMFHATQLRPCCRQYMVQWNDEEKEGQSSRKYLKRMKLIFPKKSTLRHQGLRRFYSTLRCEKYITHHFIVMTIIIDVSIKQVNRNETQGVYQELYFCPDSFLMLETNAELLIKVKAPRRLKTQPKLAAGKPKCDYLALMNTRYYRESRLRF